MRFSEMSTHASSSCRAAISRAWIRRTSLKGSGTLLLRKNNPSVSEQVSELLYRASEFKAPDDVLCLQTVLRENQDGTYIPELDFFTANFSSSSRETLLRSDAVRWSSCVHFWDASSNDMVVAYTSSSKDHCRRQSVVVVCVFAILRERGRRARQPASVHARSPFLNI